MRTKRPQSLRVLSCLAVAAIGSACSGTDVVDDACSGLKAGDLVITEVLADPIGTDTGKEYFEFYNATNKTIPLAGLTLMASRADGTSEKWHVVNGDALPTAPAGSYVVVGDVRDENLPDHVTYPYGAALGALANADGRVAIRCGDTLIDEMRWGAANKSGYAFTLDGALTPDASANDVASNICAAPDEFQPGSGIFGSPGLPNAVCGAGGGGGGGASGTCNDVANSGIARPLQSPQPGQLFITEVMANPTGTDADGEWVEVFSTADVDLNGVTLILNDDRGKSTTFSGTNCLRIAANSYAVIARSDTAVTNGQLPSVVALYKFDLLNSAASLKLLNGETVIDAAAYPKPVSGVASQLNPLSFDANSNDDEGAFCAAPLTWTQTVNVKDRGSPGAENPQCGATGGGEPPPPQTGEGQCRDTSTGQLRDIRVATAGSVIVSEVMADPNAVTDTVGEWFELYAVQDIDMNGVDIKLNATTLRISQPGSEGDCIPMPQGSYRLFAKNRDTAVNGGLPTTPATPTFATSLPNTGTRALSVWAGTTELDSFAFISAAGVSHQVSSSALTAAGNDLPANVCSGTATYGAGDRGTPGTANTVCTAN